MIIKSSVVDGAAVAAPYCLIKRGLLGAYSFSLPLKNSRMNCWIWSFLDDLFLVGSGILEFGVSSKGLSLGLLGRKGDLLESV